MKWDLFLCDADDTLFDFRAAEASAFESACAKAGVRWDDDTLGRYRAINEALWLQYERGEISQQALHESRCTRFFEAVSHKGDPGEFGELYLYELSRAAQLIPGALAAIREIARFMPVVIVTNGITNVQHGRLDASPIRPYVRDIAISAEVGAAKPDPRIFRAALEMGGGVSPERAVMAGDSLKTDIAGAKAAGIASIWYNPSREQNRGPVVPDYEIASLEKLPELMLRQ